MKQYRVTLTVDMFINAEDQEAIDNYVQDIKFGFSDPYDGSPLELGLFDFDVVEVDPLIDYRGLMDCRE